MKRNFKPLRKARTRSAGPKGFVLFRHTTHCSRPSLREIDAALLVCDTMLSKIPHEASTSVSVWDILDSLTLPTSQLSWLRALIMDLAGPSPAPNSPRLREDFYRAYVLRARSSLRAYRSERLLADRHSRPRGLDLLSELFEDVSHV